jgi:Bacteriophage lambda head decoration protein D
MTTLNEGKTPGDWLFFEENGHYSREEVTLTGGKFESGTVLGQITANKKYTISDEAASDGTETAKRILLNTTDASTADQTAVVIARHAQVRRGGLSFHTSYDTQTKRDGAMAELDTEGIIAR